MNNLRSQIEPNEEIKSFVADIKFPIAPETLIKIRDRMFSKLEIRPLTNENKEKEEGIRWKRTAAEIFKDSYVYDGRACTDLVVLFISFCRALGLETRFVKMKKGEMVHSIAEIKLPEGWYVFDASAEEAVPRKGEKSFGPSKSGWQLWKKGRDAWDLGLEKFEDIEKIKI